jgi:hypothetical protein
MCSIVVVRGEFVRLMTTGRTWTWVGGQRSLSTLARDAFFVFMLYATRDKKVGVYLVYSIAYLDGRD